MRCHDSIQFNGFCFFSLSAVYCTCTCTRIYIYGIKGPVDIQYRSCAGFDNYSGATYITSTRGMSWQGRRRIDNILRSESLLLIPT